MKKCWKLDMPSYVKAYMIENKSLANPVYVKVTKLLHTTFLYHYFIICTAGRKEKSIYSNSIRQVYYLMAGLSFKYKWSPLIKVKRFGNWLSNTCAVTLDRQTSSYYTKCRMKYVTTRLHDKCNIKKPLWLCKCQIVWYT